MRSERNPLEGIILYHYVSSSRTAESICRSRKLSFQIRCVDSFGISSAAYLTETPPEAGRDEISASTGLADFKYCLELLVTDDASRYSWKELDDQASLMLTPRNGADGVGVKVMRTWKVKRAESREVRRAGLLGFYEK